MVSKSDRVILRTYGAMWDYEIKIYAIDKFRLAVPVNPNEILYIAVGLIIVFFLGKLIPPFTAIPFVLRIIIIPFLIMKFLTKKKFDGKLPHKFLMGYLSYLSQPKAICRFQPAEAYKASKFTSVAYRNKRIVDATDFLLQKGGKKRV